MLMSEPLNLIISDLATKHLVVLVVAVSTTVARKRQDSVLQAALEAPSTEEIDLEHALPGP